jgi:DNA-directed RNA polymerase specialized sigma24 family protein
VGTPHSVATLEAPSRWAPDAARESFGATRNQVGYATQRSGYGIPRTEIEIERDGTGAPVDTLAALRQGGPAAVQAVLDSHGVLIHEYLRLLLGDQIATVTALTNTVLAALEHCGRLRDERQLSAWLMALARVKAHEYYAAGWDEFGERYLASIRPKPYAAPRREEQALRVITDSGLLRMWPDDRELFILSAPAYQLNNSELARVFGMPNGTEISRYQARAWDSFARAFDRSADEAGYGRPPSHEAANSMYRRAVDDIGRPTARPGFAQVIRLATSPSVIEAHEDIRTCVGTLDADGFPVVYDLMWPGL